MLVCSCLLFSSVNISFFFNVPSVLVRICLLFSYSIISLVSFSGSPVPKGISFEGIFFPTVIVVLWFSNHTVFNGVSPDVLGYKFILVVMLSHICTRYMSLPVRHLVTTAFFFSFSCALNVG